MFNLVLNQIIEYAKEAVPAGLNTLKIKILCYVNDAVKLSESEASAGSKIQLLEVLDATERVSGEVAS